MLELEVALELELVDAFHLVGGAQVFPLEGVRVDLVSLAEELFLDVEAALLGGFKGLVGAEAEAEECLFRLAIDCLVTDG